MSDDATPHAPDPESVGHPQPSLPTDLDELQAIVRALQAQLAHITSERDHLAHRVETLLRARFGHSSEKLNPDQLRLFFQEEAEPDEPSVDEDEGDGGAGDNTGGNGDSPGGDGDASPNTRKRRRSAGRNKPGESLPRTRIEIDPQDLPRDEKGKPLARKIGEEVSEILEYVPARLVVFELARTKWVTESGPAQVCVGELPVKPIPRGLPGPSLLAQVLGDKFFKHLPLYRQEETYERLGHHVSRGTLSGWVHQAAQQFRPLYEEMKLDVLASRYLATDDTKLPYLLPGKGKVAAGYLWPYVGDRDHPHTIFDFTVGRSGKGPAALLGDWRGFLHADAFPGYDKLFESSAIVEVACWAHTRRKYLEAMSSDPVRATQAIRTIARLYAIEAAIADATPVQRIRARQEEAVPILAEFKTWILEQGQYVLPRSPIATAIKYTLDQWDALTIYTEHEFLRIDNNAAENSLRKVVLGRKNFLFAGSACRGQDVAILYSLVESCRRHEIDCYEYFRDVILRVQTQPSDELAALMPARWSPSNERTIYDAAYVVHA